MIEEFKEIVGEQSFAEFLRLLTTIGPDARTHRISVVIAAMLQYARSVLSDDVEEGTLAHALVVLEEEPYGVAEESEEYLRVFDLIDALCTEAGMRNLRQSYQGEGYSIADGAIAEYTRWYNMPWETY
jgi:hypothetical protein